MKRTKNHNKRLNHKDVETIIEKYRKGHSLRQISLQYGLHEDTVRRVLSAKNEISKVILNGMSILATQFTMTEETKIEIEKAVSNGSTLRFVANRYGVSAHCIQNICDKVRLSRGEPERTGHIPFDKPKPKQPNRETIFTWAAKWEAAFDARVRA